MMPDIAVSQHISPYKRIEIGRTYTAQPGDANAPPPFVSPEESERIWRHVVQVATGTNPAEQHP